MSVELTQTILALHTVWSICVPIAIVESFVPDQQAKPWLGRVGLAVTAVIYVSGAGLVFLGNYAEEHFPTAQARIQDPSLHGVLHNLSTELGFPALLAACFVFARWFAARDERGRALYSALSGSVFLISVVLAGYGFPRTGGLGEVGGLFQRISVVCGWVWRTSLAIYLLIERSAKRVR